MRVEARGTAASEYVKLVEDRAARLVGYSLFVLVAYVVLNSGYGLFIAKRITVLMIGLAATRLLDWGWPDSVAALALIPLIIKEARAAISGEPCSSCNDTSLRTSIRDGEGGG